MRRWPICIAFVIALLTGCSTAPPIDKITLMGEDGSVTALPLGVVKLTVVYFLSPQCPLCISYTGSFKELESRFDDADVRFVGVFAGPWSDQAEIDGYKRRYGLRFPMLRDPDLQLARALKATVTPEAFLLDSTGNVLYSGSLDNWMNALGKKKQEVTAHHLSDAISAALDGRPISPKRTKAVGCLIE